MNIGLFTSTRADYGLLRPLGVKLEREAKINLTVFVTGTHLSHEYGYTVGEIEKDGYKTVKNIPMSFSDKGKDGVCNTMGNALIKFSEILGDKEIDVMVILGDRYEAFVMATVCHVLGVPIAHIHGGEVTEGAIDDAFRHSITKMAALHFTSCEEHRKRVLQLGEDGQRVYNVGALGVENILKMKKMNRSELEESLEFELGEDFAVVTCHPETLGEFSVGYIDELFRALRAFPELKVVFTGSNADDGGKKINEAIKKEVEKNSGRYIYRESLGLRRYLSAVGLSSFVIGNSSSGIIEVPQLGKIAINIGDRQKGRKRSGKVLDVPWESKEIEGRIREVIEGRIAPESFNEFGCGETSEMIKDRLIEDFEKGLLREMKKFNDLGCVDG